MSIKKELKQVWAAMQESEMRLHARIHELERELFGVGKPAANVAASAQQNAATSAVGTQATPLVQGQLAAASAVVPPKVGA